MRKQILKLIFLTSVMLIISSLSVFASYSDIPKGADYENSVSNLARMKVIEGYDDGTFKPEDKMTRAQLMKVIVISLGKSDEAASKNYSTIFSDVPSSYWANGYINVAVANNVITGYSDGTFRPEQEITFSQAITILLRAVGYGSSDISGVWPQNYIEKAKSLKITDGYNLKADDVLNRATLSVLLDRTINTKVKGTTKTLAEQSGLGTVKTCVITNSWDIDNTLSKGAITTDTGTYVIGNIRGIDYLGKKVNGLIDSSNNLLSFGETVEDSNVMFVYSIAGNNVSCSTAKGNTTINIPDNMSFYYNGQKSSFKDIKQNVEPGSFIALAITIGTTASYDYGVLVGPNESTPIVVKKDVKVDDKNIGNIDITDKSGYIVIKNGKRALIADIKQNDVLYYIANPYIKNNGILLIYDNKVTGTYDDVDPTKNTVTKITILGKQYEIETSDAVLKLNDSEGAFDIGDKITILTGATGKIVDVIAPNSIGISNIGIVLSTRKSNTTGILKQGERVLYYVKLYTLDGNSVEYQANENEATYKGKLVYYDFDKDGIVNLSTVNYNKISGTVNKDDKTIGDSWLSDNVIILDMYSNYLVDEVIVRKISISDLPSEVLESQVIHAHTGGLFNDVQLLVVNVPAISDSSQFERYGILVSSPSRTNSDGDVIGSYTVIINGKQVSYYGDTIFAVESGDIVYLKFNKYNQFIEAQRLVAKDTSKTIQAVDSRRIKINGKIYRMAKDAQIYDITGTTQTQVSLDNLDIGDYEEVSIYVGNTNLTSGLIKVITFKKG